MAIIETTDTATLQEIRFEIHPSLTVDELPDPVITRRTILRSANRETLKTLGMSDTEYTALDVNDKRRAVAEEIVILECAYALIPTVEQIVMDNENGLMTRYQEVNWNMRQRQLTATIERKWNDIGITTNNYYSVDLATNEERKPRYSRRY